MMYLDLDELPHLFAKRWFWSTSRAALARFRREDHIGKTAEPLSDTVRALVQEETGYRPDGPIRLLTNLSYFGYCFNPVSFYYCFDKGGEHIEAIVAEVNNTPWGERDTYVLRCGGDARSWRFQPVKKMHVSPFMPMDIEYDWVLSAPTEKLSVYMANSRGGEKMFSATLALERKPITGWALASVLLRYPFMTARVTLAIYWQALRLWLRKVPFCEHPAERKKVALR